MNLQTGILTMDDLNDDLLNLGIRRLNQARAERGARWLYNGLIPDGGFGVLLGDSGVGKSTIAIDLSAAIVTATPFAGYEYRDNNSTKPYAVLYIYGEGGASLDARVAAAYEARKQAYSRYQPHTFEYEHIGEVPIVPWDLTCTTDGAKSLRSVSSEFVRSGRVYDLAMKIGLPIGLIVVDTWAAVAGLSNENDNGVVQDRINSLKEMANEFDSTLLVVAHTKKGTDEMRGATGVFNTADFVLRIDKKTSRSEVLSLVDQKTRHGPKQALKYFRLISSSERSLQVGGDFPPLIVDWLDDETAWPLKSSAHLKRDHTSNSNLFMQHRQSAKTLRDDDMSSFDVYIEAVQLVDIGHGILDVNGASWVTLTEARAKFDSMYQRNAEANRKAFERAHNRATTERRVLVRAAEDGRQFVHFVE